LSCLQPCETPVPSSTPCMRPKYCPVPGTLTPHRCATICHSKAWQSTPCGATAPRVCDGTA
jgi:hypothetical protein